MNEKIQLWQGILIGGLGAATTVIMFALQSWAKIRTEIAKFKEIQTKNGRDEALKLTRLSHADVKKRKL